MKLSYVEARDKLIINHEIRIKKLEADIKLREKWKINALPEHIKEYDAVIYECNYLINDENKEFKRFLDFYNEKINYVSS